MSLAPLIPGVAGAVVGLARPLQHAALEVVDSFATVLQAAHEHDGPAAGDSTNQPASVRLTAQRQLLQLTDGLRSGERLAPLELSDLRQAAESALQSFHDQLQARLEHLGFRPGDEVAITGPDAEGQLRFTGDVQLTVAIEQLLADDPSLRQTLQQVIALHDRLQAASTHTEFAADYARDPRQALETYAHLFDQQAAGRPVIQLDETLARVQFDSVG